MRGWRLDVVPGRGVRPTLTESLLVGESNGVFIRQQPMNYRCVPHEIGLSGGPTVVADARGAMGERDDGPSLASRKRSTTACHGTGANRVPSD